MAGKEKFTVEEIAETLQNCAGFVSETARALGCDPKTIRSYLDKYPSLATMKDDIIESFKDTAESALVKKIKGGNLTAIIFFLKCKAKDRGYIERHEIDDGKGRTAFGKKAEDLTDDELARIIAEGAEDEGTSRKIA